MAEKAKVSDMTPLAYMGLVAVSILLATATLWGVQTALARRQVTGG